MGISLEEKRSKEEEEEREESSIFRSETIEMVERME